MLVSLMFFSCAPVKENSEQQKTRFGHEDVLYSDVLEEDRRLKISLPDSYYLDSADHYYPVVFVFEDNFFQIVSAQVRHLGSMNRMPESIVVGISEGPWVPKVYSNGSSFWESFPKQLPFGGITSPFAEHIERELIPYLEKTYRATDYRIAVGFSSTSLFVFDSLFNYPTLFKDYIAIAAGDIAGMGYDDGVSFVDDITSLLGKQPEKEGSLFIASSDSDVISAPEIANNLKHAQAINDIITNADFKVRTRIYQNEGHYDIVPLAVYEALNYIFPRDKWSPNFRKLIGSEGNALKNIDQFHQKLSDEYGFTVYPKAERWNSINSLRWACSQLVREKRYPEAVEVCERRSGYNPTSHSAYASLADALFKNQQQTDAIQALEKAINLAIGESSAIRKSYEGLLIVYLNDDSEGEVKR